RLLLEDLPEDHPARSAARGISRTVEEAEALAAQLAAFSGRPEIAMVDVNRVLLLSEGAPRRNLSPWSLPIEAEEDDVRHIVASLTRGAAEVTADAVHVDVAFARMHAGSRAGMFARITARGSAGDACIAPEAMAAVSKCGGFVLNLDSGSAVYLPIAEGAASSLSSRVSAPRPRETVLLVQEEPLIREVSRDLLERLGYSVLLAENTGQAEYILSRGHRFQVAIADLPEAEAAAHLVNALRRERAEVKVILITANPAGMAHEVGADSFLPKPFSSESLNNEIRRLLK
ncbi:MAG: response regulator, partial [Acidobacteriota bacterium]|nr:response regulator [Acidobacteriota bacterium]